MRKENKETGETLRKVKEEFQEKLAKKKTTFAKAQYSERLLHIANLSLPS